MKIEHVAIWVEDIDKVCEFYRKYFGGVVQPPYHNPAKQFTSRFITFDDGARLEIMHRPDILSGNVGTMTESKPDMLMLGHAGVQAPRRDTRHCMFHVKHSQTEDAAKNLFFDISEVQQVGHEVSQYPEHIGFAHVSFSVGSKEKVDQLTQQMFDDGITIVGQPRTTGDGYYESVVLDPEGNRIEITI